MRWPGSMPGHLRVRVDDLGNHAVAQGRHALRLEIGLAPVDIGFLMKASLSGWL